MLREYECGTCSRIFKTRIVYEPASSALCKFCKGRKTNLERYGVTNIFKKKEYIKECTAVKYGVDNVRKAPEVIKKIREKRINKTKEEKRLIQEKSERVWKEKYGENYKQIFVEHQQQTVLEKYGVTNYMQSEEGQRKYEKTSLEKYGTRRPTESVLLRKQISDKWKSFSKEKMLSIRKIQAQKYSYENITFDSSIELAFYIYCKDFKLNIKRCEVVFEYNYNNQKHLYIPDFEVNGQLIEIKGNQFLKEDDTWCNPFDRSQDELYEAKHQCALKNNVKILYTKDYQKYLDYIEETYGKNYLNQFRNKKEKNINT